MKKTTRDPENTDDPPLIRPEEDRRAARTMLAQLLGRILARWWLRERSNRASDSPTMERCEPAEHLTPPAKRP